MSQPRPVFHPIAPPEEVSDEELAEFASSRGVGTMVKPATQPPTDAPQIARDASSDPARTTRTPPPRKASTVKKTASAAKPTLPDLKLSVEVPGYVGHELRIKAAHQGCTVRHLVLKGLHAIGIPIEEADLNPDERRIIYREQTR